MALLLRVVRISCKTALRMVRILGKIGVTTVVTAQVVGVIGITPVVTALGTKAGVTMAGVTVAGITMTGATMTTGDQAALRPDITRLSNLLQPQSQCRVHAQPQSHQQFLQRSRLRPATRGPPQPANPPRSPRRRLRPSAESSSCGDRPPSDSRVCVHGLPTSVTQPPIQLH